MTAQPSDAPAPPGQEAPQVVRIGPLELALEVLKPIIAVREGLDTTETLQLSLALSAFCQAAAMTDLAQAGNFFAELTVQQAQGPAGGLVVPR